jgi:hypothetical protein
MDALGIGILSSRIDSCLEDGKKAAGITLAAAAAFLLVSKGVASLTGSRAIGFVSGGMAVATGGAAYGLAKLAGSSKEQKEAALKTAISAAFIGLPVAAAVGGTLFVGYKILDYTAGRSMELVNRMRRATRVPVWPKSPIQFRRGAVAQRFLDLRAGRI